MRTDTSASKLLALLSLASGLISVALLLVFLFLTISNVPYIASSVAGIAGIALGIAALRKRQAKAIAVTGLVLSAVGVLTALTIFVFALLFVGAMTPSTV